MIILISLCIFIFDIEWLHLHSGLISEATASTSNDTADDVCMKDTNRWINANMFLTLFCFEYRHTALTPSTVYTFYIKV